MQAPAPSTKTKRGKIERVSSKVLNMGMNPLEGVALIYKPKVSKVNWVLAISIGAGSMLFGKIIRSKEAKCAKTVLDLDDDYWIAGFLGNRRQSLRLISRSRIASIFEMTTKLSASSLKTPYSHPPTRESKP